MGFAPGMNLVPTIIGFGMSTTFIVFVCTRLICGRLRRLEAQQLELDSTIDLELPHQRISGLDQVVVDAIPTVKFNCEAFSSVEDAQCTICLTEYAEKEVLRIMPKCGFSFHLVCIDPWLRKQSTCPVCRVSIQPSNEAKHTSTNDALSMPQSLDGSVITVEHSQQWLLPIAAARSDADANNRIHTADYIPNALLDSEISRETTSRWS